MIFHKNRLPADDSHVIPYLIFSKTRKDVAQYIVCCSRDRLLKGKSRSYTRIQQIYPTKYLLKRIVNNEGLLARGSFRLFKVIGVSSRAAYKLFRHITTFTLKDTCY